MNACTHGEDRLLNERVKIPAEHFRAALDDLARAAGGKLLVLVLFLDGLDLKIADALTGRMSATAPIRPVSSSVAKRTFSISC